LPPSILSIPSKAHFFGKETLYIWQLTHQLNQKGIDWQSLTFLPQHQVQSFSV